jgi:exosortase
VSPFTLPRGTRGHSSQVLITQRKSALRDLYLSPHPLLVIAALVGLISAAFLPSVRSLFSIWNGDHYRTYEHGFLILGVSAWLLIRQRQVMGSLLRSPSWIALALLVTAVLLWFAAIYYDVEALHQAVLPAAFFLGTWAILGWPIARLTAFPFAYLYFANPGWSQLNDLLVRMAVAVERAMLWLSRIPCEVQGALVHIPEGTFEVEPGCNGLSFLLVATAVAALIAHLERLPMRRGAQLVAIAALVAFLANTIRIHSIILIGHFTRMTHPIVADHKLFGWMIFAVCLAAFVFIVRRRLPAAPGA